MPKKAENLFNNTVVTGNLLRILKAKNISRYELAKSGKISQGVLGDKISGRSGWTYKTVKTVSELLGVSMNELTGEKETKPEINAVPIETYGIKVYSKVAAGLNIERWDNEVTTIDMYLPQLDKIKGKKYSFIINGDSMRDRFRPGDYVICTEYENTKPKDRDIVVIFYDTGLDSVSGNCKKFIWVNRNDGTFMLQPLNPYDNPTYGTWDKVTRIFKVHLNISPINYSNN